MGKSHLAIDWRKRTGLAVTGPLKIIATAPGYGAVARPDGLPQSYARQGTVEAF